MRVGQRRRWQSNSSLSNAYRLTSKYISNGRLAITILTVVLQTIFEMLSIYYVGEFLSVLTDPSQINMGAGDRNLIPLLSLGANSLTISSILLASTISISSLLRFLSVKLSSITASKASSTFSKKIYEKYLNAEYWLGVQLNSAYLIDITSNSTHGFTLCVRGLIGLCTNIISIAAISASLVIYSKSSLIVIIILPLAFLLVSIPVKKAISKNGKSIAFQAENHIAHVQDSTCGFRDILLNQDQKSVVEKYADIDEELRNNRAKSQYLAVIPRFIIEPIAFMMLVIFALYTTSAGYGAIPSIGVVLFALSKVIPSLQAAFSSASLINSYLPSARKSSALMEQLRRSQRENRIDSKWDKDSISIEMRCVSLKHRGRSNEILENITLRLESGKYYLFEGTSGEGKSTLIDIMLCLIKPTSGKVLLNGEDPWKNIGKLTSWQKSVYSVSQKLYLPGKTLEENLISGCTISTHDAFFQKIFRIMMLEQICSNPTECESVYTGESGSLLSGGQRQRVALARALLSRKQYLFLDEATNALDAVTEKRILSTIHQDFPRLTIIHVSHNESNRAYADKVYQVKNKSVRLV